MRTYEYNWRYSKEILYFEKGISLDELFGKYYKYEAKDIIFVGRYKLKSINIIDRNEKYDNFIQFSGGYALVLNDNAYYVFGPYTSFDEIEKTIQQYSREKIKIPKKEETKLTSISYYLHKLSENLSFTLNLASFFSHSDRQKIRIFYRSLLKEKSIRKLPRKALSLTKQIKQYKDEFEFDFYAFYIFSMLKALTKLKEKLKEITFYFYNENIKIFSLFPKVQLEKIELALVYLIFKKYRIYKRYDKEAIDFVLKEVISKISKFFEREKITQALRDRIDKLTYEKIRELTKEIFESISKRQDIEISFDKLLVEIALTLRKFLNIEMNDEINIKYSLLQDEIKNLLKDIESEEFEKIYSQEIEEVAVEYKRISDEVEDEEEQYLNEEYLKFVKSYVDYDLDEKELKNIENFVNIVSKVNVYPITKALYLKIRKAKDYFLKDVNFIQYLALKEKNYKNYTKLTYDELLRQIFDFSKLKAYDFNLSRIVVDENKFYLTFSNMQFVREHERAINKPHIRKGKMEIIERKGERHFAFSIENDVSVGITLVAKNSEYIQSIEIQNKNPATLILKTLGENRYEYTMIFNDLTLILRKKKDFVIEIENYSKAYLDNNLFAIIEI